MASEKRAYSLADRSTYLARRDTVALEIVFQGSPDLRNVYHVYAVNPARHPKAKFAEAQQFIAFLVSPAIQRVIRSFGRDRFGEPLFFADALPASTP